MTRILVSIGWCSFMENDRKNNREIVPFEIDRVPDTELSEGEELILIHGREGLRIWGDDGSLVNETEPTAQVIAYGPKSRVVPAGEVRVANNDLNEGVQNIVFEGSSGIQLIDENGEVIEEYEPVPMRIEYGPTRKKIPFETIRKPNNDLEDGEEKVVSAGKTGLQLVDEEGNATLVSEAFPEEIEYGPERVPVLFKVKRQPNHDLAEGETQLAVSGVNGLQLEDEEGNMTLVSEPVSQVIEYGPFRHYISFETKRTVNFDLAEGEEKVIVPGEKGVQLEDEEGNITLVSDPVTEEIEYGPVRYSLPFETERTMNPDLAEREEKVIVAGEEGLELEDENGNITLISEPVTEEIEYGPIRHYLPFETERIANPDIAEEEEQLITSGREGFELEDEGGNITPVSDPVTEVVEYGPIRHYLPYEVIRQSSYLLSEGAEKVLVTGQQGLELENEKGEITRVSEPVTEEIEYGPVRHYPPFESKRTANPELAEREEKVIIPGKEGIQLEDEDGSITLVSEPVTEEVEYGPLRLSLPFESKRAPNPKLVEGEEQVVVFGKEGIQLEDEEGNITPVAEPVTEEVEYGPVRQSVPFESKRVPNPELAEGEERIATAGEEGIQLEDETGKQTSFKVPVVEVVEYGPVRISLPYETVRVVNTELKEGQEHIATPGQKGVRLEDEEGNTIETQEPITEEIEYGPRFEIIPYKTVRHPRLELEEGDTVPISKGINGIKLINEKGKTVEIHVPFAEEVAYGPDAKERKELKKKK